MCRIKDDLNFIFIILIPTHVIVLMDANTRTEERGDGGGEDDREV